MKNFCLIFLFTLVLTSCGLEGTSSRRTESKLVQVSASCSCTFEYNPVCGVDGKTYDNPCMAQCFQVQFVSGGTCANLNICNQNSGSVCGQPPMPPCPEGMLCAQVMPAPKLYNNECEMSEDRASPLPMSSCESL